MIPYGKQYIDRDDVLAVQGALTSDFLTTGSRVTEFEHAVSDFCGVSYGAAVVNGTAALHCAMFALGVGPGDEVIVPSLTFAATANCVLFQGAIPVFADVEPDTLLIDPADVLRKITPKTRALIGVDFAGQPCDWDALAAIARDKKLTMVADGCHALGAEYKGHKVGSLAQMNVFSFHPVKHITTGEGGMVVTDHADLDARVRLFRNHGITTSPQQREKQGTWFYEMTELGMNYRLTDIQCALGLSQMRKLDNFLARRREIASIYDRAFASTEAIRPLQVRPQNRHAYHLYVVRVPSASRAQIFKNLRAAGIGVNVHYIPVHLHPYYQKTLGTRPGLCPMSERAYEEIISLPMYPALTDQEQDRVIDKVIKEAEQSAA